MKIHKIGIVISIITMILCTNVYSIASYTEDAIKPVEYTEDYKNYLNYSNEEKQNVLVPQIINIDSEEEKILNPIKFSKLGATPTETSFSLKDVISKNVVVKNQEKTKSCWTFAALSALETNLALNVNKNKVYDFSERHMEYATSRNFLNNKVNEYGYNRDVDSEGNWVFANTYLTNGLGAVNESDMPFENDTSKIDLEKIQNKKVTSEVYDTINFTAQESTEDLTKIKQQMKNHIKEYGAIAIQIHGAQFQSEYYKNSTGAIYCDNKQNCPVNHGVSIVGWNDNYAVENFNSLHRPKNNGAWIIKNSWGTKVDVGMGSVNAYKETMFTAGKDQFEKNGITNASQITDEMVIEFAKSVLENQLGETVKNSEYVVENDTLYIKLPNDGFMYLSYEDVNAYSNAYGIVKASDTLDYENIYQYDILGATNGFAITSQKAYLANIFNKKTTGKEYLTQVSIYAPETYTCKVYVNPNGSSIDSKDLNAVELKAGESETFGKGYHTLEFAKPVEIKADSFAVELEIEGTRENQVIISTEAKVEGVDTTDVVEISEGKCLVSYDKLHNEDKWIKLSEMSNIDKSIANGDSTIKAFTTSNYVEQPKETPTTSNMFDNAKLTLKSMKSYTYTDPTKKEYAVMNVELNNVKINDNDSDFYYYLSSNKSEENITDWIKIDEKQTNSDKLVFNINTKDVKNYDEISKANTLYLYIKQSTNNNEMTSVSKAITLDVDVSIERYVDDQKVENIKYNADVPNVQSSNQDTSMASKELPNTGIPTYMIIILIVSILGCIVYARYKYLSKYVK